MSADTIFFTLLFSFIGIGYLRHGKNNSPYFMIAGILLMLFPYFVTSLFWEIMVGTLLVVMPFILNMMGRR